MEGRNVRQGTLQYPTSRRTSTCPQPNLRTQVGSAGQIRRADTAARVPKQEIMRLKISATGRGFFSSLAKSTHHLADSICGLHFSPHPKPPAHPLSVQVGPFPSCGNHAIRETIGRELAMRGPEHSVLDDNAACSISEVPLLRLELGF